MDFNWECYLSLAEALMNTAKELEGNTNTNQACLREAYLRSALSRFYYGVFCVAHNLLSKYVQIPRKDTHNFVICMYSTASDPQVQKIGNNLKRLWGTRKQADYDDEMKAGRDKIMSIKDIADEVDKANQKARNTMKQIKNLQSDALLSFNNDDECRKISAQFLTQTFPK